MYEQEKLNAAQLTMENARKESKKLQRGEILKQNELQLQVKKDREKGYKEHDFVESKKVFAFNLMFLRFAIYRMSHRDVPQ